MQSPLCALKRKFVVPQMHRMPMLQTATATSKRALNGKRSTCSSYFLVQYCIFSIQSNQTPGVALLWIPLRG